MLRLIRAPLVTTVIACGILVPAHAPAQNVRTQDLNASRPFGTLREQAAVRQEWLRQRMETILPALMRKHGIDMWVVPMREYNEDPVFSSIVSPTTFAARRRTIYVFFDRGGGWRRATGAWRLDTGRYLHRHTLTTGGAGQHRGREPGRSCGRPTVDGLEGVIEQRNPARIAIEVSRTGIRRWVRPARRGDAGGASGNRGRAFVRAEGWRWT